MTKTTYGRKSLFGFMVPEGYQSIMAGKHGGKRQVAGVWWLGAHIFNRKREAGRTSWKLEEIVKAKNLALCASSRSLPKQSLQLGTKYS